MFMITIVLLMMMKAEDFWPELNRNLTSSFFFFFFLLSFFIFIIYYLSVFLSLPLFLLSVHLWRYSNYEGLDQAMAKLRKDEVCCFPYSSNDYDYIPLPCLFVCFKIIETKDEFIISNF